MELLSNLVSLSLGQKFVFVSIIMLIVAATFLSVDFSYDANIYATIAYFLLVLGVLNLIFEYLKGEETYMYVRAILSLFLLSYLIYSIPQLRFLSSFIPIYRMLYIIPIDVALLIGAYRVLKHFERS